MYSLRDGDNGLLNMENLKVDYNFNEYNPAIIEKTVNDEAIKLIGDYYYDGIKVVFELGDNNQIDINLEMTRCHECYCNYYHW